jgi:hypothetical protein
LFASLQKEYTMKGIIHIFMQSAHKNQFAYQTIFQTDSDSPGGSGEAAPKENQGADQENQGAELCQRGP